MSPPPANVRPCPAVNQADWLKWSICTKVSSDLHLDEYTEGQRSEIRGQKSEVSRLRLMARARQGDQRKGYD